MIRSGVDGVGGGVVAKGASAFQSSTHTDHVVIGEGRAGGDVLVGHDPDVCEALDDPPLQLAVGRAGVVDEAGGVPLHKRSFVGVMRGR